MTDPNLPPVTPPPMFQPPAAPVGQAPAAPQIPVAPAYAPNAAYPQSYPQQGPAERYNVLAIISLVTAVLSISLAAIITGHIALSQIKRTGEKGRGLAIAGLVLGYLGILAGIIVFFLVFIPIMVGISNDPSLLKTL
jgi:hypothetical protein